MHHDGPLFAFYWKPETTEFQYCLLLENEIQIFRYCVLLRKSKANTINHFD
jgi:hypothetical protein